MAIKQQYRSMQGKVVDLGQLIAKNELVPAVGNARVNARGDELGPGGKIVRTKEEIMQEYYKNKTNTLPDAMPHRAKTTPVTQNNVPPLPTIPAPVNVPAAVDDVSPEELSFDDPEELPPVDFSKRKRTT
jgi:hypothetical protein